MPDVTITFDAARHAAITTKATEESVTVDQLVQAEADHQADILRQDQLDKWWRDLTIAQKQTIYDANQ